MTNCYISSIIDINDRERILHIAARGTSKKDKRCEIAVMISHLNISDENEDWKVVEFGLPGETITQLISIGIIIFAGTNFGNIYKSFDAGETWVIVESSMLDNCVMLTDSIIPDTIYASSETKAIRSTDAGDTWEYLDIEFNK